MRALNVEIDFRFFKYFFWPVNGKIIVVFFLQWTELTEIYKIIELD